jgi:hypothetical protein
MIFQYQMVFQFISGSKRRFLAILWNTIQGIATPATTGSNQFACFLFSPTWRLLTVHHGLSREGIGRHLALIKDVSYA